MAILNQSFLPPPSADKEAMPTQQSEGRTTVSHTYLTEKRFVSPREIKTATNDDEEEKHT